MIRRVILGNQILFVFALLNLKMLGNSFRNLRLQRQDIRKLPVILLTPDLSSTAGIHKIYGNNQRITLLQKFSCDNSIDSQILSHLTWIDFFVFIGKYSTSGHNANLADGRKIVDNTVCKSITEVLGLWIQID